MNTGELRLELRRLLWMLEDVPDEPTTREHARQVKAVWEVLHGGDRATTNQPQTPYDRRVVRLHARMPNVRAWCVVKEDDKWPPPNGSRSVWPGQAYGTRPCAEHWRDFLEDFYRDVHVRDGVVRWVVERRPAPVAYYWDDPIPAGNGYTNRSRWVGTLPMEVFERTPEGWRRK